MVVRWRSSCRHHRAADIEDVGGRGAEVEGRADSDRLEERRAGRRRWPWPSAGTVPGGPTPTRRWSGSTSAGRRHGRRGRRVHRGRGTSGERASGRGTRRRLHQVSGPGGAAGRILGDAAAGRGRGHPCPDRIAVGLGERWDGEPVGDAPAGSAYRLGRPVTSGRLEHERPGRISHQEAVVVGEARAAHSCMGHPGRGIRAGRP